MITKEYAISKIPWPIDRKIYKKIDKLKVRKNLIFQMIKKLSFLIVFPEYIIKEKVGIFLLNL